MSWLKPHPQGTIIFLQIQPKASRTEAVGLHGTPPRLKVRVSAPPVEGQANEAVVAWLSKALRIPKSQIHILRGDLGRAKDVLCVGVTPEQITEKLGIANAPTAP